VSEQTFRFQDTEVKTYWMADEDGSHAIVALDYVCGDPVYDKGSLWLDPDNARVLAESLLLQASEADPDKPDRLAAALELLREMRRPNHYSCACQRRWAERIDAILEER